LRRVTSRIYNNAYKLQRSNPIISISYEAKSVTMRSKIGKHRSQFDAANSHLPDFPKKNHEAKCNAWCIIDFISFFGWRKQIRPYKDCKNHLQWTHYYHPLSFLKMKMTKIFIFKFNTKKKKEVSRRFIIINPFLLWTQDKTRFTYMNQTPTFWGLNLYRDLKLLGFLIRKKTWEFFREGVPDTWTSTIFMCSSFTLQNRKMLTYIQKRTNGQKNKN
jgi:hypothetical protein